MATTRRMFSVVALAAVSLALCFSRSATGRADDAGEAKPSAAKSPAAAEAKGPEVGEVRIRTLAPKTSG